MSNVETMVLHLHCTSTCRFYLSAHKYRSIVANLSKRKSEGNMKRGGVLTLLGGWRTKCGEIF